MSKHYFMLSLWMLLFLSQNAVFSVDADHDAGTLIVTYKTDSKGERLNRIRFWLKGEDGLKQSLYPKGKSYVDDREEPSRMIVIEDIPIGRYTLKFLVPNTDSYFMEVPPREVIVSKGDVVKIDQHIKPQGINRKIATKANQTQSSVENADRPFHQKKKSKKETGNKDSNSIKTAAQSEGSSADKSKSLKKATEERGFGKLIISYDITPPLPAEEKVLFRLAGEDGSATTHPSPGKDTEVPLKSGNMVMVQSVQEGSYTIEFFTQGDMENAIHRIDSVRIEANKTKSIHESLKVPKEIFSYNIDNEIDKYSLSPKEKGKAEVSITANIPTAVFILEDIKKKESREGSGRLHTFEGISPDRYILSFGSTDPFFVPPKPVALDLTSGEDTSIEAVFETLGKLKILSNISHAEAEISSLDDMHFRDRIEITDGIGTAYLPEGEYRISFKSSVSDRLSPHPHDIKIYPLQTKEVNAYFEQKRNGLGVRS